MDKAETKTALPKSWELVMDLRVKAQQLTQNFEKVTLQPSSKDGGTKCLSDVKDDDKLMLWELCDSTWLSWLPSHPDDDGEGE